MRRQKWRSGLIARGRNAIALLLLLAACSGYHFENVDTLYFGTQKPDKTAVTREEWTAFVHAEIEPRLSGFTGWTALGDYKGQLEATMVVQVVHNGEANAAIDAIIAAYKKQFKQESVLRIHSRNLVAFQ